VCSRGFTLVEVLAVLAIVLVVLAVVFPVFAKARARDDLMTCEANMRQLVGALLLYAQDHSELLPPWCLYGDAAGGGVPAGPGGCTWDSQISRFYRSSDILHCPASPYGPKTRSYAMPRYVSGIAVYRPYSPATVVLLFEKGAYLPGERPDATAENFAQSTCCPDRPQNAPFHRHSKNFAFLDGHVKLYKQDTGPFLWVGRTNVLPGTCVVPGDAPLGDWYRPELSGLDEPTSKLRRGRG